MLLRLILYCEVYFCTINIVIFLDFHSAKHGLQWLILGHVALTKIKCIPIGLHYCTLSKHWWKVAWQKARKTPPGPASFLFREWMNKQTQTRSLKLKSNDFKQLLDEVFVISRIISLSLRLRLITLTETFIILDITKTESGNCFIIHSTNYFFLAST